MFKSPLLLALVLSAAPVARAQDVAPVSPDSVFVPGARIRLQAPWSPSRRIVGTVEKTSADSIVVDTADVFAERRLFNPVPVLVDGLRKVSVPITQVRRVEISMGRSRLMGATIGALIGGAYVGLSSVNGRANPRFGDFAAGFAQGTVVGFTLGAPVGWTFTSERWRPVAVRQLGPQRNFAGRR